MPSPWMLYNRPAMPVMPFLSTRPSSDSPSFRTNASAVAMPHMRRLVNAVFYQAAPGRTAVESILCNGHCAYTSLAPLLGLAMTSACVLAGNANGCHATDRNCCNTPFGMMPYGIHDWAGTKCLQDAHAECFRCMPACCMEARAGMVAMRTRMPWHRMHACSIHSRSPINMKDAAVLLSRHGLMLCCWEKFSKIPLGGCQGSPYCPMPTGLSVAS